MLPIIYQHKAGLPVLGFVNDLNLSELDQADFLFTIQSVLAIEESAE